MALGWACANKTVNNGFALAPDTLLVPHTTCELESNSKASTTLWEHHPPSNLFLPYLPLLYSAYTFLPYLVPIPSSQWQSQEGCLWGFSSLPPHPKYGHPSHLNPLPHKIFLAMPLLPPVSFSILHSFPLPASSPSILCQYLCLSVPPVCFPRLPFVLVHAFSRIFASYVPSISSTRISYLTSLLYLLAVPSTCTFCPYHPLDLFIPSTRVKGS